MGIRDPLLLPLAALSSGIVASRLVDFSVREAGLAFAVLLGLAGAAVWRRARRAAWASGLASLFFVGILVDLLHRPGPDPEIDFAPGEIMILSGCVVEPPVLSPDREQFVLELADRARVRVTLYPKENDPPAAFRYGQRLELEARLRKPRNFGNSGAFDYAGHLARRHIYWTATAGAGARVRLLEGGCGSVLRTAIFRIREAALERLDVLFASDSYALGITRATLLGDSSRLEKVWAENYKRTGTYHALVISGFHLTTLAACFLFLLRICSIGAGASLLATAAIAWLYTLLVGAGTPVVRAAAGLTLYLLGRCFFRKTRLINLLAAIAIAFLLADPEQLFDASFQFSFFAVALIGAVALPLLEKTSARFARGLTALDQPNRDLRLEPEVAQMRLELRLLAQTATLYLGLPQPWILLLLSWTGRAWFYLVDLMIVSVAVQLGMTLPMVVYFHRVSVLGISANLLIVPLMSLVVPLGFLAVLTGSRQVAAAVETLLWWSRRVAEWHAGREPLWRVPDPPVWVCVAFCAALLLVVLSLPASRVWKYVSVAAFGLVLAVLAGHPFPPAVTPGALEITTIDVGQGDSILVSSPEGGLMLVDGGGLPSFGARPRFRMDIGEDVVSPYLWSRSIRRLDVIAVTHAHADHIGGVAALVENFRPKELWIGALADDSRGPLREQALRSGARIVERRAGERFPWRGADVEVYSPPADVVTAGRVRNNDSLVFRLAFGETSFLLTGDVERQMERSIVEGGALRRAQVLKVAHHGSRTSTTDGFLETVRPSFAVISVGADNLFRHPHPEVLDKLHAAGATVWRTDRHGRITIRSDGRRLSLESHQWPIPVRPHLTRRTPF